MAICRRHVGKPPAVRVGRVRDDGARGNRLRHLDRDVCEAGGRHRCTDKCDRLRGVHAEVRDVLGACFPFLFPILAPPIAS